MTVQQQPNSFRTGPDERGHFGIYGGRFVAETLMPLILQLEKAYAEAKVDPAFKREMDAHLKHYVGRPSPLYFAERLTEHFGDDAVLVEFGSGASEKTRILLDAAPDDLARPLAVDQIAHAHRFALKQRRYAP